MRKDFDPVNFAILRHIALDLLKQEQTCKRSIKGKRLMAGWREDYLFKVLSGLPNLSIEMRLPWTLTPLQAGIEAIKSAFQR